MLMGKNELVGEDHIDGKNYGWSLFGGCSGSCLGLFGDCLEVVWGCFGACFGACFGIVGGLFGVYFGCYLGNISGGNIYK